MDLAFATAMFGMFLINFPGLGWTSTVVFLGGDLWVFAEIIAHVMHRPPGEKWIFRNTDELEQHIVRQGDAAAHWVLMVACWALDGASRLWPSRPELQAFRGVWALLFAVRWLTSAIVRWRYR